MSYYTKWQNKFEKINKFASNLQKIIFKALSQNYFFFNNAAKKLTSTNDFKIIKK